MSELDHVVLPVSTFERLQEDAINSTPPTTGQRVAGTAQALLVLSAVAAIVPVASYTWVRCQNWLDEKREERRTRRENHLSAVQ